MGMKPASGEPPPREPPAAERGAESCATPGVPRLGLDVLGEEEVVGEEGEDTGSSR